MSLGKVAVIGAGPGGLAAAMELAGRGYQVTVYEKQPYIGGRTSRVQLGEYKFDRGPTFFMMPQLLEEMFQSVNRSLHDYVKLIELDPLYRLQFGDVHFSPTRDEAQMLERIEELFPGNGQGYLRFMKEEGEKFNRVSPLLQRPFGKLSDYISHDVFQALPRLNAIGSVYDRLSRYFSDERLKYAFTFQAKYLGMSPWECPGTFTILAYLEHKFGLFHPIGGVNRVCQAMAEVIREYDGVIATSCSVKRVLSKNGKAVGLLLDSGDKIDADHIIINADFATAMSRLFEPGELRKYSPAKLAKKKYSCSTYMMYLGVDREIKMPHHTVLFAENYRANVHDIMTKKVLSQDASIYIHNPGIIDASLAPQGKTALYALMPVPNLSANVNWDEQQERVKEAMLNRMEQEPELKGFSSHIKEEAIISPLHWRNDHDVYEGATFNLAHTLDQMMLLRPHNRFEELGNCWLVGGGTHPGSGLPTIFESARISTRLLMAQDRKDRIRVGGAASPIHKQKEATQWK
ncbi:phytoene desaturase [Paenibacillus frigoriresistens]|uniref:phytoene desaturase family protein n=1 Tax=Paenibacillus alginolyticus TaxID=59839 RepID=UPI0015641FA7|nr:phytoene desaturase family protein [Paenibacillus frigoriresistens]NRF91956.1 phytoene desaturase [Paenibacillus frigoriresistens]